MLTVASTHAALADEIDEILRAVQDASAWQQLFAIRAQNLINSRKCGRIPSESDGEPLIEAQANERQALAVIYTTGNRLAEALERIGVDSSDVLYLVNTTTLHGGGSDAIWPTWPDRKVRLQQLAMRLRNPPESRRAGAGEANPSESAPHSATPKHSAESVPERSIPDRARRAWEQYRQAVETLGGEPSDRQVYDQLAAAFQSSGESAELPAFDTWQRNLREYRRLTAQQKNKPRAAREHPRVSCAQTDQLDVAELPTRIRPKRADE